MSASNITLSIFSIFKYVYNIFYILLRKKQDCVL